ncbi:uncharacterized protein MYCFIDRAFT_211718 [Pseudocercospora fijiensis CIRAD86]|uniref:Uncharacterized protein n=1 Tax=Pseudocercospora fijiensis (strain CIRAD86) TaxID=383855 RepID=M2ZPF0_PSEFD|nr:uncharacterized protein MYCFIDRAFT_211718 [Pseudocercospora fijiensis CIRAD86]EME80974.1 hypothetical protein MYCFIDRAFT_211718 [Pseudocercospora fijiensis CIRAD86]
MSLEHSPDLLGMFLYTLHPCCLASSSLSDSRRLATQRKSRPCNEHNSWPFARFTHTSPALKGHERMDTNPAATPSLLALAAEIRYQIWEYSIPSRTSVSILKQAYTKQIPQLIIASEPDLARVCKALRHEILSAYYSSNEFVVRRITFGPSDSKYLQTYERYLHTYEQYLRALKRWRAYLYTQPAARQLKSVNLGMFLTIRDGCGGSYDEAFDFIVAKALDGRLSCRLTNLREDFCVCHLRSEGNGIDLEDGRCLVDAMILACKRLYSALGRVECGSCSGQKLVQIEEM